VATNEDLEFEARLQFLRWKGDPGKGGALAPAWIDPGVYGPSDVRDWTHACHLYNTHTLRQLGLAPVAYIPYDVLHAA